jgi:calcium-dependent protein kinase
VVAKPARRLSSEDLHRKSLTAPAAHKRLHFLPRRFEDDYELDRVVLGSGYNGDVCLGRSRRTGACVAVKTFLLGDTDERKVEQALDEAEIYLALDHPHVVRLHDVFVEDDRLHLVMECMDGGELFDRVCTNKAFSEAEAAQALRQMLTAVAYLHSQSIAHCDLKLENFLFEHKDDGWLKLCDFGFSQLCPPNSALYKQGGTMRYMSPGMFQGCYTTSSDTWSLGVIAFILLTGKMPFTGPEEEIREKILKGSWDQSSDLWGWRTEALEFVQGLLHLDPYKRLTATQALTHPWLVEHAPPPVVMLEAGVLQSLRAFAHCTPLQRAGFSTMAWTLSTQERSKVRQVFLSMDSTYSGTLSLAEVSDALGKHGIDEIETAKIFESLDIGNRGQVGYSDFLASMCVSGELLSQQRLDEVFDCLDCDRSGAITMKNIKELAKSNDSLSTCVNSLTPQTSVSSIEFADTLRSAVIHHL